MDGEIKERNSGFLDDFQEGDIVLAIQKGRGQNIRNNKAYLLKINQKHFNGKEANLVSVSQDENKLNPHMKGEGMTSGGEFVDAGIFVPVKTIDDSALSTIDKDIEKGSVVLVRISDKNKGYVSGFYQGYLEDYDAAKIEVKSLKGIKAMIRPQISNVYQSI